jgi:ribosomal protein S18 acetylase RimI-like enzyme
MDLEQRRRLADANVLAAFSLTQERLEHPRGASARFGAVEAVAVGVDVAFFNPVLALDIASRPVDVLEGIAWVEAKGLPVSVQIGSDLDADVRAAVEALGLVADPWATPVMGLEPISQAQPAPPGIVLRTGGRELFDDFHAAIESGELFRRIFGPSLVADPRVRLAVGYLDGAPVSGAAAIGAERTVGIYSVGTREPARRRGIGRAVTWAAIGAGRDAWGSEIAILQSSEMGASLYHSMGFEEIGRYIEFERPKG